MRGLEQHLSADGIFATHQQKGNQQAEDWDPQSKRNTLTVTDGETLTRRHWKALFLIFSSWRKTGKPMKNTDSKRNIKILYCGSLIGAKITYSLKKSLERLEFYKVVPDVGLSIRQWTTVKFLKGCIWKIKLNKQFFTEQREIVACLLTVLVFLRNLNGYQPLTRVPVASVLWIPPASTMATASFTRYIPKTWGHKLANISFLPGKGRKMSSVIFQEILTEISFSILSSCKHSEMI